MAMAEFYETVTTIALLFCSIKTSWAQNQCINSQYVIPGQTYTISNPLYPSKYPAGQDCTWFFSTANNYEVRLNCPIVDLPKSMALPPLGTFRMQKEPQHIWSGSETLMNPLFKPRALDFKNLEWDSRLKSFPRWESDRMSSTNFLNKMFEENQNGFTCQDYLSVSTAENPEQDSVHCQPFNVNGSKITMRLSSMWLSRGGVFSCNVTSSMIGSESTQPTENCTCGWMDNSMARIVGGKNAEINEFPSMALLSYKPNSTMSCGATIIGRRAALTAAHCVDFDKDLNNRELVVGEHDRTKERESDAEKRMKLSKIVIHKSWSPSDMINDIALLITEEDIEYSVKVGPVCLPFSIDNPSIFGENVTMAGWGYTSKVSESPKRAKILQKVQVQIIEDSICGRDMYYNPTRQLCTYAPKKDACKGDSGGPLYYIDPITNHYTLVGIVSYGKDCATSAPSVNTDVHYYLPWIKEHLPSDIQLCGRL